VNFHCVEENLLRFAHCKLSFSGGVGFLKDKNYSGSVFVVLPEEFRDGELLPGTQLSCGTRTNGTVSQHQNRRLLSQPRTWLKLSSFCLLSFRGFLEALRGNMAIKNRCGPSITVCPGRIQPAHLHNTLLMSRKYNNIKEAVRGQVPKAF